MFPTDWGVKLLDSQCILLLGLAPSIPTEPLGQLPCHEDIWAAPNANIWSNRWKSKFCAPWPGPIPQFSLTQFPGCYRPASIRCEMERIYRVNRVPDGIGAFSFLLLLLCFFRDGILIKRAWEIGLTTVISRDGNYISYEEILEDLKYWKTLNPEQRIGEGPMESVIFQTYQLIGILYLVPLQDLYSFSGWEVTRAKQRQTRTRLAAWIAGNGRSARAVALRAGRLFSYCQARGTLTRGYLEPRSMLIAALALCAYNSAPPPPDGGGGPFGRCIIADGRQGGSGRCQQERQHEETRMMRLDRPIDDLRTVEDWVGSGCHYRGFIGGLGNIHGLRQLCAVLISTAVGYLDSLQHWRAGSAIAKELARLYECAETCKDDGHQPTPNGTDTS